MVNVLSIGRLNVASGMICGMPTTTLAERLRIIREKAGYGGRGGAAAFAKIIGISPPALSNLESGESRSMSKSLPGYLRIGASLDYIERGKGKPMIYKDVEGQLRVQTIISMLGELDDDQRDAVEAVIKGMIRNNPKPSRNDPWKEPPPQK